MNERRRQVWVGTTEAAEIVGTDVASLHRLIDEGLARPTRIGLMTYLNARDLYPLTPTNLLRGSPQHPSASSQ